MVFFKRKKITHKRFSKVDHSFIIILIREKIANGSKLIKSIMI